MATDSQRRGCERLDSLQISNRRVIVWTGSRVTTHNLRILLHYVKVAKPVHPAVSVLHALW